MGYRKDLFMAQEALGLLECKGLVCLMEGTDAMLKSANVEMMGWDKAGSGMVTAFVRGDVAAVKAALDAGAEAAGRVGQVIAVHVIPRPHDELGGMMPKKKATAPVAAAARK
jgi:ethanolamine utilization protein EutM